MRKSLCVVAVFVVTGLIAIPALTQQPAVKAPEKGGPTQEDSKVRKDTPPATEHKGKKCCCCGHTGDGHYGGPWGCPVFPIMQYSEGTLYYCDRYPQDPCNENSVEADYLFGDYPWPYQHCPDSWCEQMNKRPGDGSNDSAGQRSNCCKSLGFPMKITTFDAGPFPGIERYMALDWMYHFPGGPTQDYLCVNTTRNYHFIKFDIGGTHRFAKVMELRINRPVALHQTPPGAACMELAFEPRFVAFECNNPGGSPNPLIGDPHRRRGDRVYWGQTMVDQFRAAPVLILLKE